MTKNNYINVTPASNDYNISQGGTVITCSGNFIGDPGTSYAPDSYYIMTFCADTTENEQIQFDFTSMGLAGTDCGICYGDDIYVYDGADIYAPELGLFGMSCGDYETYWWWSSCPISIIRSTNGCLTFKFITTDHFCLVGENTGWTASISCVPSYPIIPDFSFISACAVDTNYFTDLSQNATSWEWNFGNGQTSTLQNPICIYYSTGTFTVTLTINGCYTITKQVTISDAPPVANITAGGPTTFCNGDSVVLNANSCIGCSYLWNTGETTQSITAWQSGLYNVTATNSCGSDEATPEFVSVNYTPVPTISTNGATEFCDGDSVILTATTADSYLWSTGETSQSIVVYTSGDYYVAITDDCGSESSQATTIVVHFLLTAPVITAGGTTTFCQGNYVTLTSDVADYYYWSTGANTQSIDVYNSGDYYVTITNSNGCQAVSAVETVIVNPNPATPVITPSGATIFCDGESVTLSCSTADDYLWNTGETSQSITVDSTGTFSVTVTNTNGCTAESGNIYTSEISAPLAPVISSVGSAIVCQGESVVLYSTSANDFLWSNGETTQYITVTDAGDYTVTVTYSCGTSVSDAFTVTVNPNPAVPVITPSGTVSICTGDFLALNCSTADYYYWSTGAITQSIDVYSAGDYSVTITDINGCTAASVSTSIEVTDPLNSFSASATVFYLPDATVDFSSVVNGPIASYLWDFGDGGTSAAANPSYTYADPGLYTVSLTVDDGNGCIETVTLTNYIWIEQVFTTTTINTGTTDNLSGVYFTSPDYGVLTTTTGNVLITDDGGSNWTTSSNTGIQYITGVSVYNGSVYISGPWGYIGVSYNNGLNWYDYNLMTNAIFNGLYFTSAGAGYAVGTEGTVYNFNGASWLAQTISTSYDFMAVYGWGDYAWAVGDYGTIWGYDGISWNAFNSGVTYNLTGVNFVNDLVGYATGATGAILSTIDGGATWNQVFDGVALGCSFTCITGANADTLWAIGDGGIVYQTLDAGLTWSRFSIGSYLDLAAIQYADGVGHIAGKDGKLYEFGSPTTTVKQTETENKIRIYPNPATSSITIEITTDTRPDYSFTMYDMLGKKVLQIEIHNSRTEVQINNLQAGLYYYNIAGGNKIIKTGKIVIQ
ncbi:MAG: PKD domain-containing protein [Bacteroidia bacterium]|nr:PKD domain-containing protein [Bacteroidia bacterium]